MTEEDEGGDCERGTARDLSGRKEASSLAARSGEEPKRACSMALAGRRGQATARPPAR